MEENIVMNIEALEYEVKLGEMCQKMVETEEFQAVLQDKFIDAWAVTNTMNMASYDNATKQRVFEKMNARGEFSKFISDTLQRGQEAKLELQELEEAETE